VNIPTKYIHIIQDQSRSAFATHKKVKKVKKKKLKLPVKLKIK